MIVTEDHCVQCGLPCLGERCSNRNVKVCYCDECNEEIAYDGIYEVDGEELCEGCLKERFKKEW